jgi:hypothetical protein
VEITGEDSCGGKRCLKFVDGPSRQSFTPMVNIDYIGVKTGTIQLSFDFKHSSDAPGKMNVEFRDKSRPYRVGPRVRLLPDGTVTGGKDVQVVKVVPDQWAHISIDFTLNSEPEKTFHVTVSQGTMKMGKTFPFASGDFGTLEKIHFSAYGNEPAVMYLDNIKFERKK